VGERTWTRFLVAGVAAVALCALTTGPTQALLGGVVRALCVVAIVIGGRTGAGAHARAWYCFAVGGTAVIVANVVFALHAAATGVATPFPSPADAFFVLGYLAIITGEVLLIRRRSADIEGDNLVDSLILATCLGVLVWAYLLIPYARDPALSLNEKLLNGLYSVLVLAVVTLAGRLAVGSGRRNPSYYFLAGSFGFIVAADVLATMQTADGVPGGAALVCSVMSYVLFATGSLHPSMARLTDRPADREIQLTPDRKSVV
jgi:hypothetical protein